MSLGRSIRIYLDGGTISGVRHAELANWTGQALLCPRSRVSDLERWQHVVARPGVYFLLGSEQSVVPAVYIGESEDVRGRVKQHLERDFWSEVLVFSSKDEILTKSHVKYLESRVVERAIAAGRYSVLNGNTPPQSSLPRADTDAMEEFLENLPLLLGVLGHRVLDKLANAMPAERDVEAELLLNIKEARARGKATDEGFVVLKGSTAMKGSTEAMSPGWTAYKETLIASGRLVDRGSLLEFAEDVLFNSPSAAAAVVYGNNANGRVLWKSQDGRTLKELEQQQNLTPD